MKRVTLKDKKFKPFIGTPNIENAIRTTAAALNDRFKYEQEPVVFVAVLNGAIPYATNLFMKLKFPVLFDTVKVSSYNGTTRGNLKFEKETSIDVKGKKVIIAEDIIDTGVTIDELKLHFRVRGAKEIVVASLLIKPDVYKERHPEWNQWAHITGENDDNMYVGISITNSFVVGYGLDYDGLGRNLNKIYILDD
jgi:hypoxanthine phosphoribosyltransferase